MKGPEATLKDVAQLAGVAPVTVSRVVNGSEHVAAATREKILAIIRHLDYTPNADAANLRRRKWNWERDRVSEGRFICANEPLRGGCKACVAVPYPPGEAFTLSREEARALARQLIWLRRDLDRLRKHAERVQARLEMIQKAAVDCDAMNAATFRTDGETPGRQRPPDKSRGAIARSGQ